MVGTIIRSRQNVLRFLNTKKWQVFLPEVTLSGGLVLSDSTINTSKQVNLYNNLIMDYDGLSRWHDQITVKLLIFYSIKNTVN